MEKGIIYLEPLCAEFGMNLVERRSSNTDISDCANVINKALAVLVENGFYAMSVFLLSCNKPEYGKVVLREIMAMLADPRANVLKEKSASGVVQILEQLREVTGSLPRLLLARKLAENALVFGRYHCKALDKALDKGSEA